MEEITDIPEEGFVMKSYVDLYMNFIMGDGMGSMQCVDFDNDDEELVMRDYMGNSIFLDVIGNTVYNVMEAYGTASQAYVAEMEGKRVIVSADVSHGRRECYIIMQYDAFEEMSVEQKEWYEKWNAEYREQYEGYSFEIAEDSITYFMSPCELGYHYDEYQDILKFH